MSARARTFITSQNHGYAVEADTLPAEVGKMSYVNANDGTCEGVDYFQLELLYGTVPPRSQRRPQGHRISV